MAIEKLMSDNVILQEIGERIVQHRIVLGFTQAYLAEQAGVSKRTVERIESGHAVKTSTLIRIFRILGLLENIDALIPEVGPRPMDLLKLKGRERQRASSPKKRMRSDKSWSWGDES